MTISQMKSFVAETKENVKQLFAKQVGNGKKGDSQKLNKKQSNHFKGNGSQRGAGKCN